MSLPKRGTASSGAQLHYSVGAMIERNGAYLLIDRVNPPFGFAGPAGHVDEGEDPLEAIKREVQEETGLVVGSAELLFEEEMSNNRCVYGVSRHYWRVYACSVEGEPLGRSSEANSIAWYTPQQLSALTLEPVWRHWFARLHVLKENEEGGA